MGSCLGRCFPQTHSNGFHNSLCHQNSGLSFSFLVEDQNSIVEENTKRRGFLSSIFSKNQNLNKSKKPVLELVDGILNPQLTSYTRLNESQRLPSVGSCASQEIPLQCLDARALLARTTTSTPVSSLDLEWEHETLPLSMLNDSGNSWTILPEETDPCTTETSPRRHGSDSDWSHVSSANSLEWDNVQNSLNANSPVSEIDTDTQFLLSEIERLTTQTLNETGKDLFS